MIPGRRPVRSAISRRSACGLAAVCLLAGCTIPADHPSLQGADLPSLVPAHRFAYPRGVNAGHRLSPDGSKIAWTGSSWFRNRLYVRNLATGVTHDYRARSMGYTWTADSRRLLYTNDVSGAENTHVYMIDTDAPDAVEVDLTPYDGVRATLQQIIAGNPRQILVSHNRRDRKVFDLYRIDLDTREETLVASNPGNAVAAVTTREGSFSGWQTSREALRTPEQRALPLAQRRPKVERKADDTFRPIGTSHDGSTIWVLSNRGRDTVALLMLDRRAGWEKVVLEDPGADVGYTYFSRVLRKPLIATVNPGVPRSLILDDALRADFEPLLRGLGAEPHAIEIVSADDSEARLVVSIQTSRQRTQYFVDRKARRYERLGTTVAPSMEEALAPVRAIDIRSSDGLRLPSYLTLPVGVAPKRLPLVLYVHGGPWLRSGWGDPVSVEDSTWVQFLANRGYAVLQVDFRGSSGYGREFSAAGIGEFGGRMQEDLLDAVRWAVAEGIADPARVGIMGWSYGGYATLMGLAGSPDTYACGISINGPTDLATLIETFPPYWSVDLSLWHDYVGNPAVADDREAMTRKSPLALAAGIRKPVLIVQGARDVRVREDQGARMAAALQAAGAPVDYMRIPDMGHGTGYWIHRLRILRRTEAFFHGCLGGRAARWDPGVAAAWVRERWSGAAEVPATP